MSETGFDDVLFGANPTEKIVVVETGDYSLLLVRRIVGGQVRTFVLVGQYYPYAKTFNAPSDAHIAAVLDVNGDGKMEIIVHGRYYEGSGTNVFQMGANGFQSVLSSGCGA